MHSTSQLRPSHLSENVLVCTLRKEPASLDDVSGICNAPKRWNAIAVLKCPLFMCRSLALLTKKIVVVVVVVIHSPSSYTP
jgi:hypothetical protein